VIKHQESLKQFQNRQFYENMQGTASAPVSRGSTRMYHPMQSQKVGLSIDDESIDEGEDLIGPVAFT
jgi:hypothetical protein